ncbi:MAG TPA: double zinc ribbon domain-containing protein, partial [bacterium]|nr:double zinc ribbon domain-containing protein [bacterium]
MTGAAALGAAADLGRTLLDLLVPRACLVCDEPLPPVPRRLCARCVDDLSALGWQEGAPLCPRCGVPSAGRCAACVAR